MNKATNENHELVQIISKLNSIESEWNHQFESAPNTRICFSVSGLGTLCLNDVPLGVPALDVDADSIFVDVQHFGFRIRNADLCDIRVTWPYNGTPHLETMHRITALRAAV